MMKKVKCNLGLHDYKDKYCTGCNKRQPGTTVYKENDNGCKHNYDEVGSNSYSVVYWCERCGALQTLYIGEASGPDSYTRLPNPNKPYIKYTPQDPGPC